MPLIPFIKSLFVKKPSEPYVFEKPVQKALGKTLAVKPKAQKTPKIDKVKQAKALKKINKKVKVGTVVVVKRKKFVVAGMKRKKPILMPLAVFKRSKVSQKIRLSTAQPVVVREVQSSSSSNGVGLFDLVLMNYFLNNTSVTSSTDLNDAEPVTSIGEIEEAHVSEEQAADEIEDETAEDNEASGDGEDSSDSSNDSDSDDSSSDDSSDSSDSSDSGDAGGGDGGGGD